MKTPLRTHFWHPSILPLSLYTAYPRLGVPDTTARDLRCVYIIMIIPYGTGNTKLAYTNFWAGMECNSGKLPDARYDLRLNTLDFFWAC